MKFRYRTPQPTDKPKPRGAMGGKIQIKSRADLDIMRRNGILVARALKHLKSLVRPGITTADLDREAETFLRDHGAEPTFLGYDIGFGGFPGSICASVNNQVVHGIPNRVSLKEGDLIGIDIGAYRDGFHADSAATFVVPPVPDQIQKLLRVTEEALWKGIEQARAGNRIGDISYAIQRHVEPLGYSVVQELVGHGVGRSLHEEPQVPNFGEPGKGIKLREGMTLAIEPMINQGTREVQVLPDKWTIVTMDGRLSAHFEHTVAVTQGEPEVLTLLPPEDTDHSHPTS